MIYKISNFDRESVIRTLSYRISPVEKAWQPRRYYWFPIPDPDEFEINSYGTRRDVHFWRIIEAGGFFVTLEDGYRFYCQGAVSVGDDYLRGEIGDMNLAEELRGLASRVEVNDRAYNNVADHLKARALQEGTFEVEIQRVQFMQMIEAADPDVVFDRFRAQGVVVDTTATKVKFVWRRSSHLKRGS